ncbi:uncharacterized protein [Venturia canescens]|uniref:uncharacterized protein n=1 Tax=Venturia canescens TaxID=32260 RepID=UPI001C9BFC42|nr:uncharacterized protein LOC122406508 [Venturia canescens]
MACRLTYERTATSTILVLLVLLEAALVLEQVNGAPVQQQQQRNDVLAGTEFLSVFINGAMAPVPVAPPSQRRRGYRRGGGLHSTSDNVAAESRQNEASIYRISRAPSSPRPFVTRSGHREESPRLLTIHQRKIDAHNGPATLSGEAGNSGEIGTNLKQEHQHRGHQTPRIIHQAHQGQKTSTLLNRETIAKSNFTDHSSSFGNTVNGRHRPNSRNFNQKVIGVSVTSTVEATPYRVRVEHHDSNGKSSLLTRPPIQEATSSTGFDAESEKTSHGTTPSTSTATRTTTTARSTTTVTPQPAHLVTEELSNIVSESNRSEFSVDEGLPKTSWRNKSPVTGSSVIERSSTLSPASASPSPPLSFTPTSSLSRIHNHPSDSQETSTSLEPVEESYEMAEENSEPLEIHKEPPEVPEQVHQARKAGRHYEASIYNHPTKVYPQSAKAYEKSSRSYGEGTRNMYSQPEVNYGEPARVYSEPAKVYGEPAKVYSEPSKIYGEPAKVYGEPERVYGEPAQVYSEPARVYSEPAKVYSEPAKVYSEPSKIYGADGRPVVHRIHHEEEPEEENYEVDEAVSVGSNGNVHGPQIVTESSPITSSKAPTSASQDSSDGHKVGYVVEDRNYRKYRVEERTPDGFIVGEYGVVSHDDGSLRGVRYTADGTIDPRLIYDALMKFLAL